jgi:hypothetical protein
MNLLYTYAWGSFTGFCIALSVLIPLTCGLCRRSFFQGRVRQKMDREREVDAVAREAARQNCRMVELCRGPLDGTVMEVGEFTDILLLHGPAGTHLYSVDTALSAKTRLPAYSYLRSA